MAPTQLFVLAGDFDVETLLFVTLEIYGADEFKSPFLCARNMVVRLIERGYTILSCPMDAQTALVDNKPVYLVMVEGAMYLRTDQKPVAQDFIDGLPIRI
jgi:hypothetical protein